LDSTLEPSIIDGRAPVSIDRDPFLHEHLAQASPDLMRELLGTFTNALLSAQADTLSGAHYGTRGLSVAAVSQTPAGRCLVDVDRRTEL
jgi:hypothetical protein